MEFTKFFIILLFTSNIFVNCSNNLKSTCRNVDIIKKIIRYDQIQFNFKQTEYDQSEINSSINNSISNKFYDKSDLLKRDNEIDLVVSHIKNILKDQEINSSNSSSFLQKCTEVINILTNLITEKTKKQISPNLGLVQNIYSKYIENNQSRNLGINEINMIQKSGNEISSGSEMLTDDNLQSVADMEPPKAYSSKDLPCKSEADCAGKKLSWMKCTVERIGIRTTYEIVNTPLLIIAKIIYTLCACTYIPQGTKAQVKCMNTSSIPGMACTLPNMIYKELYKSTVMLWKSYQEVSNQCTNPITPYPF